MKVHTMIKLKKYIVFMLVLSLVINVFIGYKVTAIKNKQQNLTSSLAELTPSIIDLSSSLAIFELIKKFTDLFNDKNFEQLEHLFYFQTINQDKCPYDVEENLFEFIVKDKNVSIKHGTENMFSTVILNEDIFNYINLQLFSISYNKSAWVVFNTVDTNIVFEIKKDKEEVFKIDEIRIENKKITQ